ncbi:MAG: hypothetical protein VX882_10985, partial [Pseudomonadota bacterium]|nr:hypothetical protein [Pseudomonadota bacterium]
LCAIYTALNVFDLEPLNRQTSALSRWHTDRCKNVQQRSTGPRVSNFLYFFTILISPFLNSGLILFVKQLSE